MTLKHIKFSDSAVMRSLEKLAVEKGIVKQEVVIKQASVAQDLRPTSDFTQNLLKLCSGLRSAGFNKQADDLEIKYLTFKSAGADVYNTSKETGEDLVDQAHPKGSAKVSDVSGDATVETIVDQKAIIEKIVGKNPTGKLAGKDILNAVKMVFADDNSANLLSEIQSNVRIFRSIVEKTVNSGNIMMASNLLDNLNTLLSNPIKDNLIRAKNYVYGGPGTIEFRIKPGKIFGMSKDSWERISSFFDSGKKYIDAAIDARTQLNSIESAKLLSKDNVPNAELQKNVIVPQVNNTPAKNEVKTPPVTSVETQKITKEKQSPVIEKIYNAIDVADKYLNHLNSAGFDDDDKLKGGEVLNDIKSKLTQAAQTFDNLQDEALVTQKLQTEVNRLNNFKKNWFE